MSSGTAFGRYTLLDRIGAGGMAEIWKAKVDGPEGFQKVFAVKKILPDLVEDQAGGFVPMFIEEAKLAATLVHPNVVQVFDFGKVGISEYYIAMEFVPGTNLARVLHRLGESGKRLPEACVAYLGVEMARGLGYVHARKDGNGTPLNLVHRDISPQNVLLSFDGEVKIADFGIAKIATRLSMTEVGKVRGKASYLSPEQARGQALDGRSDLFAMGIVLFESATCRRFFAPTAESLVERIAAFPGLEDWELAELPASLRAPLQHLLQPDLMLRTQFALEVESELASAQPAGSLVRARGELASLVKQLFAEEHARAETPGIPVAASTKMPSAKPAEPPRSPTMATPTKEVKSHADANAARIGPVPPTMPSSISVEVPISTQVPAAPPAAVPPGPLPHPRRNLYRALGVMGIAGVSAALALGGNKLFSAATPTPTPVPPTPIAAVSTPAPTPTPAAATPESSATPVETIAAITATPEPTPTAVAIATAKRTPKPLASPVRTPVAATPAPTPTAVAVVAPTGTGFLTVTAKPWCEVLVDGKVVAAETPLLSHPLSSGPHTVRLRNPATQLDQQKPIQVSADKTVVIDVDAVKRTVSIR